MERGTIVKNLEEEFFIFLSYDSESEVAKVLELQEVFDEYENVFCTRGACIKKFPLKELRIADKYPNYFNQISIT